MEDPNWSPLREDLSEKVPPRCWHVRMLRHPNLKGMPPSHWPIFSPRNRISDHRVCSAGCTDIPTSGRVENEHSKSRWNSNIRRSLSLPGLVTTRTLVQTQKRSRHSTGENGADLRPTLETPALHATTAVAPRAI